MSEKGNPAETAKICRATAAQADSFGADKHFLERRMAYVYCAAASLANNEARPALECAEKAVAVVVAQGHDDGSSSSAAYGLRAQAKAMTGDLSGADKDLDEAENFERALLGQLAGRQMSASYTHNLRALLEFHARVSDGPGAEGAGDSEAGCGGEAVRELESSLPGLFATYFMPVGDYGDG